MTHKIIWDGFGEFDGGVESTGWKTAKSEQIEKYLMKLVAEALPKQYGYDSYKPHHIYTNNSTYKSSASTHSSISSYDIHFDELSDHMYRYLFGEEKPKKKVEYIPGENCLF